MLNRLKIIASVRTVMFFYDNWMKLSHKAVEHAVEGS
jgi:hypothetical protein